MEKRIQIISALLLALFLLLPSNIALSQDADEYGYASLSMTLELEDALRGKSEVNIARAYRDIYQTHYDRLISNYENQQRDTAAENSKKQRDVVMQVLNDRVKKAEDNEDYFNNVMFVIQAVLVGGADSADQDPSTEPNPLVFDFLAMHENQTKKNATDMLYGHVASSIPESGSVISSSSSQIYNVNAGLPGPSVAPALSQNNAPTLVPTIASVSNGGNSGGSDVNILKPLRFTNKGLYDATVRVASYTPADGVSAGMSSASTVVFRDSNPTAYLDLPLGTYVFCYDWDLGTDADKDGYVDYAHKNTSSVTLTARSTDNMNSSQAVTLNPGSMDNPNGKCGTTPPVEDAGGLTPQELANQGTHTYHLDCPTEENLGGEAVVTVFKFVAGGVNVEDQGDDYFYNKININTYTHFYSDFALTYTFTFTNEGFTMLLETDDESATCTGTRR